MSRESEQPGILECVCCNKRFSIQDARAGAYRLETMVCSYCYATRQKMPYAMSCFGKPMLITKTGKKE